MTCAQHVEGTKGPGPHVEMPGETVHSKQRRKDEEELRKEIDVHK